MIQTGIQLLVKIKRIREGAKLPVRSNLSDAGLDLFADESITIYAGQTIKIATAIAIELPPGTVGLLLDRSSLGSKGIHNFAGVIDSGYRGEIFVVLHNSSNVNHRIERYDKISQLVVFPILLPVPYEVEELSDSDRGNKGFGSSGV